MVNTEFECLSACLKNTTAPRRQDAMCHVRWPWNARITSVHNGISYCAAMLLPFRKLLIEQSHTHWTVVARDVPIRHGSTKVITQGMHFQSSYLSNDQQRYIETVTMFCSTSKLYSTRYTMLLWAAVARVSWSLQLDQTQKHHCQTSGSGAIMQVCVLRAQDRHALQAYWARDRPARQVYQALA